MVFYIKASLYSYNISLSLHNNISRFIVVVIFSVFFLYRYLFYCFATPTCITITIMIKIVPRHFLIFLGTDMLLKLKKLYIISHKWIKKLLLRLSIPPQKQIINLLNVKENAYMQICTHKYVCTYGKKNKCSWNLSHFFNTRKLDCPSTFVVAKSYGHMISSLWINST